MIFAVAPKIISSTSMQNSVDYENLLHNIFDLNEMFPLHRTSTVHIVLSGPQCHIFRPVVTVHKT